jgi:RNA polymerase sigma factor (sigma-70 family)
MSEDAATDAFVAHRNLLFTVAYEMLGSAADAEDVLQETWLRWSGVDQSTVRDPRAYLVRVATRQALTRLRTLHRRREDYVGPWLPEPLLTTPDVAEDVELADSVSTAMLLVLETLTPTERAVFVLRDVFALEPRTAASRADGQAALAAFRHAIETGDLQGLLDILAPDVVALGDGGGVAQAVRNPVVGAKKVGNLLRAGLTRFRAGMTVEPVQVNGHPALLTRIDGRLDGILTVRVDDGLVTGLYYVRNPEKLSRVERETTVTR